ncbi:MAG: tetratricopeptide repeat protein [Planctomycetaceae bacterium]|nr:tetratricopeptide repeat protein [Planctomycetaceae bacterium]
MNSSAFIVSIFLASGSAFGQTAEGGDELLSMLDVSAAAVADVNTGAPADLNKNAILADRAEPNRAGASSPVFGPNAPAPLGRASLAIQPTSEEQSRRLRQQFLMSQIEPVETLSYEEQEKNLSQLIAQLRALEPPRQNTVAVEAQAPAKATPSNAASVAPQPVAEPNVIEAAKDETAALPDPNSGTSPLLMSLQKADRVVNPLLLADALFRQGLYPQAYDYYKTAMSEQPEQADNVQWALFQMANCCRYADPAKAKEHYNALISRFPNCLWNASATSRLATIEWTMNESLKSYIPGGPNAESK